MEWQFCCLKTKTFKECRSGSLEQGGGGPVGVILMASDKDYTMICLAVT